MFNEFFGDVRNVRNDKKRGIVLGFFQIAVFVVDSGM